MLKARKQHADIGAYHVIFLLLGASLTLATRMKGAAAKAVYLSLPVLVALATYLAVYKPGA